MRSTHFAMSLLFLVGMGLAPAAEKPNAYQDSKLLIEAKQLADPATRKRLVLLDTRANAKYQAGHIEGARRVDADSWSKAFNTEPNPDAWAKRFAPLAIDPDVRVIVYGESDTPEAARIWWILRYWGIKNVRLLDGGWQAWEMDVGKISTEELLPSNQPLPNLRPQQKRLTTMDQLLGKLADKQVQIIDARSHAEFCGGKELAKRSGAIPGATHLEWKEVIDQTTQRFKSPEQLSKLFQEKKIDLKRPIVTHCQSGGRAAVMAFALELMGAKDVSNYYKSWAEWGNAENTPIVKPKEP